MRLFSHKKPCWMCWKTVSLIHWTMAGGMLLRRMKGFAHLERGQYVLEAHQPHESHKWIPKCETNIHCSSIYFPATKKSQNNVCNWWNGLSVNRKVRFVCLFTLTDLSSRFPMIASVVQWSDSWLGSRTYSEPHSDVKLTGWSWSSCPSQPNSALCRGWGYMVCTAPSNFMILWFWSASWGFCEKNGGNELLGGRVEWKKTQ